MVRYLHHKGIQNSAYLRTVYLIAAFIRTWLTSIYTPGRVPQHGHVYVTDDGTEIDLTLVTTNVSVDINLNKYFQRDYCDDISFAWQRKRSILWDRSWFAVTDAWKTRQRAASQQSRFRRHYHWSCGTVGILKSSTPERFSSRASMWALTMLCIVHTMLALEGCWRNEDKVNAHFCASELRIQPNMLVIVQ